MLTRDQALVLDRQYLKTENTIKHLIATEAIMRALARRFAPAEEDLWGLTGLLHDLDYEVMANDQEHGIKTVALLKEASVDLPETAFRAIKAHCFDLHPEFAPQSKIDWSLYICDSLTGLITACALVHPSKKLASIETKSILKKFKDKAFARGTRREEIALCEEKLGLPLPEFVELGLTAMRGVAEQLGL